MHPDSLFICTLPQKVHFSGVGLRPRILTIQLGEHKLAFPGPCQTGILPTNGCRRTYTLRGSVLLNIVAGHVSKIYIFRWLDATTIFFARWTHHSPHINDVQTHPRWHGFTQTLLFEPTPHPKSNWPFVLQHASCFHTRRALFLILLIMKAAHLPYLSVAFSENCYWREVCYIETYSHVVI